MNDLSEKILETIKEKGIKPKPRWQFLLKDYLIWAFGVTSLLIGGLAFSVILYMLVNNDWDIARYLNNSFLSFVFVTLPYFWIIFLGIFIFVTYYNFKHTKKGYQYTLQEIIIASVLISVILGALLYGFGFGREIEKVFSKKISFYRQFTIQPRLKIWAHSERGVLGGIVISIDDQEHFELIDPVEKIWKVNAEDAVTMPGLIIEIEKNIKMIGQKIDEENFKAERIFIPGPMQDWFRPYPIMREKIRRHLEIVPCPNSFNPSPNLPNIPPGFEINIF